MAPPKLPDAIYSPEQVKACVLELERLAAWRQRQDVKQHAGMAAETTPDFAFTPELTEWLGPASLLARLTAKQIEECRLQLQDWLKQPVTHVTFAVPAPTPTKRALVKWFRTEISPNTLIKFNVNRNVVGGMVVRTPKRIHDFSFRWLIQHNKERIPEILNRV